MIHQVISIYKPLSLTPLQAVKKFQEVYPEYQNRKIGYAGRLDPMAEGVLLLLMDEENKKKREYENLPKNYEFTILLGISTDSYDLLGKITSYNKSAIQVQNASKIIASFIGKYKQTYPPYSSKTVRGKPLYYWARNKKLSDISLPTKTVLIDTIKLTSITSLTSKELLDTVTERIVNIQGDFRQQEIIKKWRAHIDTEKQSSYTLLHVSVSCSSGTYVRSLAIDICKKLGFEGCVFSIRRTAVGEFNQRDALVIR